MRGGIASSPVSSCMLANKRCTSDPAPADREGARNIPLITVIQVGGGMGDMDACGAWRGAASSPESGRVLSNKQCPSDLSRSDAFRWTYDNTCTRKLEPTHRMGQVLVSDRWKFIYINVPKTGSSTVKLSLSGLYGVCIYPLCRHQFAENF